MGLMHSTTRQPAPEQPDNPGIRRVIAVTGGRIASSDLLAGCREIVILHNGEDYTLRITSNGKLILTK